MNRSKKLFTIDKKLVFYFKYIYLRVFAVWFEVKTPRLKYFLFEIMYALSKLIPFKGSWPYRIRISEAQTKFGHFLLRSGTMDSVCASPVFEREDIDYLLDLAQKELSAGRKVLFLDIGADFGTYSITLGNRFRDDANLKIIAYEPAPENRDLLTRNITLNRLDSVVAVVPYALGSRNATMKLSFEPAIAGSSSLAPSSISGADYSAHQISVKVRTFDSLSAHKLADIDTIIAKLDVEGYESEVLKGASSLFNGAKKAYIMVEDFVDDSVIEMLESKQAVFRAKLTPYNSWWEV